MIEHQNDKQLRFFWLSVVNGVRPRTTPGSCAPGGTLRSDMSARALIDGEFGEKTMFRARLGRRDLDRCRVEASWPVRTRWSRVTPALYGNRHGTAGRLQIYRRPRAWWGSRSRTYLKRVKEVLPPDRMTFSENWRDCPKGFCRGVHPVPSSCASHVISSAAQAMRRRISSASKDKLWAVEILSADRRK